MTTTPNAVLAYKTLDHIEAHPETWNQREWWCDTGGCFAGWAVHLAGLEVRRVPFTSGYVVREAPGRLVPIEKAAMEVLGIHSTCDCADGGCAPHPFDASNTLDDLRAIVLREFGPRPGASAPVDTPARVGELVSA